VPLTEASWIHGTSVEMPAPNSISIARSGRGTTITASRSHQSRYRFAIPTPAVMSDDVQVRLRLDSVMLVFTTQPPQPPGAQITTVGVWDGGRELIRHELLRLEPVGPQHFQRFDVPAKPTVAAGVSIVAFVSFAQNGQITFHAAGVDFST